MTDETSEQIPADEDKRKIIENAITTFRPEDFASGDRGQPESCLVALANAATVRRLTKHRRLIDALRRSPVKRDRDRPSRADLDDAARRVLDSTLAPDLPASRRQQLVAEAKSRLDDVVTDEGEPRLQHRHWQHWVHSTNHIYRFTTHERTLSACNDEQQVWKLTPDGEPVPSRLIVAQFWSDLPAAAFRDYVQPKNWPQYCTFWTSVDALPQGRQEVPTEDGYDWDFEETVSVINQTLKVPLRIGFRELPDQSRVWTRFNLSDTYYAPATQVDVDTGMVSAESVPNGPAPTLVKATKYVHWRDENQPDLTAHACDLGWSELMVEMAHAAVQGIASPRRQASRARAAAAKAPTDDAAKQAKAPAMGAVKQEKAPADDAVKHFVDAVAAECQQTISDNRKHLRHLIGRFTGQSWEAGWINDLLDMGLVTAHHYGNIASDIRQLADSLGDATARRGAPTGSATTAHDAPAERENS